VVTHPPRKTRFRLLVRLYRTGLVTRRVPSERFQASAILLSRASWRDVGSSFRARMMNRHRISCGCNDSPFPSFLARCRFIFSGENDEPTPDFPRHRISRRRSSGSSGDTRSSGNTILNFSEFGMVPPELCRLERPSCRVGIASTGDQHLFHGAHQ